MSLRTSNRPVPRFSMQFRSHIKNVCSPPPGGIHSRDVLAAGVAGHESLPLLDQESSHALHAFTLCVSLVSLWRLRYFAMSRWRLLSRSLRPSRDKSVWPRRTAGRSSTLACSPYVNEGKLAGIVMLVARDGKVGHLGTYGQMDIENKLPMPPRCDLSDLFDDQADHRRRAR